MHEEFGGGCHFPPDHWYLSMINIMPQACPSIRLAALAAARRTRQRSTAAHAQRPQQS
jgi:hypothetical protein